MDLTQTSYSQPTNQPPNVKNMAKHLDITLDGVNIYDIIDLETAVVLELTDSM